MRIGIDARNDGTGVGRYTFSLIRELAELDTENEYVLFLNREQFTAYGAPGPNFRTVEASIPWFTLREQVGLPRLVARERLDLMHYPHVTVPLLTSTPFVVTIHDLNYLDGAATGHGPRHTALRAAYRIELAKVRRARRLIAVSEHTAQAIERRLGAGPPRVTVIYEAADPPGHVAADRTVLERHGLDVPYFLYVGAAYPYKNLERLITAFARVDGDYKLVLGGDHEQFAAGLREHASARGVSDRVVFPGVVSDAELAALYGAAHGYTFVSLSEGFGLPGLEAMQFGVPVVAARSGSLPEIYGDAARYCDPYDADSIAEALAEVAADEHRRAELSERGRRRVAEFSWARTAEQTLAVYREALLH